MAQKYIGNKNEPPAHAPVALIQTQDSLYAEPLREYLVKHGCLTFVNTRPPDDLTYLVIIGDSDFVKEILDKDLHVPEKVLAIVYEGGEADVRYYLSRKINIAIVDPVPLDQEAVRALLLLLFTGTARSLITRKAQNLSKSQSVISKPLRREPIKIEALNNTDQNRVTDIMRQIFEPRTLGAKNYTAAFRRIYTFFVGLFLFSVVILITYFTSVIMAGSGLYLTGKLLLAGRTSMANYGIRVAKSGIQTSRMFISFLAPIGRLAGIENTVGDHERVLSVMSSALLAQTGSLSLMSSGMRVVEGLLNTTNSTKTNIGLGDIVSFRSEIVQLDQNLSLVQAGLKTLAETKRFPFTLRAFSFRMNTTLFTIETIRTKLSYFERLCMLYPQLAGYRKKQTYLVLLQNSMELRPTGGFIGSIALVTFVDGKISNIEIQDVYTADGQLKGHVDPPLPIREILGQEHWYLRDSNWDPNFIHSGAQAAWFYEKEMGIAVDGVIGISVPFITKLLSLTGPLDLPDYNDRISETNFFAKSLLYTQSDFFPGSTQKKDFLGSLSSALIARLTTNTSFSVNNLFSIISGALDAKDIQLYVPNVELSSVIKQWGWSGGVDDGACVEEEKGAPCIREHIEVIEANLGVNKVNYFIQREALSSVSISQEGTLQHSLTYSITNNSTAQQVEGGGAYRLYIRLFYPKFTNLQDIQIDGVPIVQKDIKTNKIQQPPYYVIDSDDNKTVVGVYMVIDPLSGKQLTVNTTRLSALTFVKNATLNIAVGKQAGVDHVPWRMIVSYPQTWNAFSEGALAKDGSLEYNTTLDKNQRMTIRFEKKL